MREALLLTEGNLSSLIAARYANYQMMHAWRDAVRKALGTMPVVQADPDPTMMLRREILAQSTEKVPA